LSRLSVCPVLSVSRFKSLHTNTFELSFWNHSGIILEIVGFVGLKTTTSGHLRQQATIGLSESKTLKRMDAKDQALLMIAQGLSTSEIATRVGVSQRTIQRWSKGFNPVKETLNTIANSIDADLDEELKSQAFKLLRLTGKSLDCLTDIIENPDTRTADKLTACKIIGDWVGFGSRTDLLSHTLGKFDLEIAITPAGEKTLQNPQKIYPLERDYEFARDSQGSIAGIRPKKPLG
jgi:transcriptional regulator with XRE-family HTH domain